MRRLALSNKKPRGIPRRLRSLKRWSHNFQDYFPAGLTPAHRYYNWKIPVLQSIIEGRYAKPKIQAQCAQALLDACAHLMAAKPAEAQDFRVTCVICLPDMFTSEVCIFSGEDYFQKHTSQRQDQYGETRLITDRSLAESWGLQLPEGMHELGLSQNYRSEEEGWSQVGDRWYFGEVQPTRQSNPAAR